MSKIQGIFGDPKARIIRLKRSQKKRHVDAAAPCIAVITTRQCETERWPGLFGQPEAILKW